MQQLQYNVIKTKNGQVGYCKVGSGKPLVMLVGYSGTLFHWNRQFIVELSKYYTLYLIDNRLVGESRSSNPVSIDGFAEDVHDFIIATGLNQPYIFGWSMGGVVAQRLAVLYANMVSKLILLSTVPALRCTAPDFAYLLANADNIEPEEFKARLYEIFFSRPMSDELKDLLKGDKAIAISDYHYRFTKDARQLQDEALEVSHHLNEGALVNVKSPALILCAKNDLAVTPDSGTILQNALHDAKLIVYPHGGHFCLHIQPLEIAYDIHAFLR